jgi:1-deoxy-D-xylulose-5-phosphate reductoisomerase
VAVEAFLAGRLPFLGIDATVERVLEAASGAPAADLDDLLEADADARRLAREALVSLEAPVA